MNRPLGHCRVVVLTDPVAPGLLHHECLCVGGDSYPNALTLEWSCSLCMLNFELVIARGPVLVGCIATSWCCWGLAENFLIIQL